MIDIEARKYALGVLAIIYDGVDCVESKAKSAEMKLVINKVLNRLYTKLMFSIRNLL